MTKHETSRTGRLWALRCVIALILTFLAFSVIGVVQASAACPALDLVCSANESGEAVNDAVADPAGTVASAVETAGTGVDDIRGAVGSAEDTVRDASAVGNVVEATIGDAPLPGQQPIPPTPGDEGPKPGPKSEGDASSGERPAPVSSREQARIAAPRASVGVGRSAGQIGPGIGISAGSFRRTPMNVLEGLAGPIATVVRTIGFPLALALLAGFFIAVQNRIDRRDPKLALAPVTPDLVEFE